jgi:hypothetical protein
MTVYTEGTAQNLCSMASGLPQVDTLENGMMAETAEDKIFFSN